MEKIAIIGGGAAGFFAAVNIAERKKNSQITIYEGSNKILSKVLISGGGRCNVTNSEWQPSELIKHYPRGNTVLSDIFEKFNSKDSWKWFEARGVKLKTEADGRVFPISNSSKSIFNCLTKQAKDLGVKLELGQRLKQLKAEKDSWVLSFDKHELSVDKLIICSGGNKQIWDLLDENGIEIASPVPSLFTFNSADSAFKELSGVSVENASVYLEGGVKRNGPLLITHAGFSGPAVLKLSAWEAHSFAAVNYSFKLLIQWNNQITPEELQSLFANKQISSPKEKVRSYKEHALPKRLFSLLCDRAGVGEFTNWAEIGKKGMLRMIKELCACEVQVKSKSTFKEEFVTAGGVKMDQLDMNSMSSKKYGNLYFAGEVLNIDAETGGYNFQAAWSTAYLVSQSV